MNNEVSSYYNIFDDKSVFKLWIWIWFIKWLYYLSKTKVPLLKEDICYIHVTVSYLYELIYGLYWECP